LTKYRSLRARERQMKIKSTSRSRNCQRLRGQGSESLCCHVAFPAATNPCGPVRPLRCEL